jgi:hypothetical protein
MATTNFTVWLSQASGVLAAIWGEDNEFLPEIDGGFLPDDGALPDGGSASDSKVRAFTFDQLKAATFNFRSDIVLGKGGFGNVYKGWLKEKVPSQDTRKWPIAVKRLDASSKQGYRQWQVIRLFGIYRNYIYDSAIVKDIDNLSTFVIPSDKGEYFGHSLVRMIWQSCQSIDVNHVKIIVINLTQLCWSGQPVSHRVYFKTIFQFFFKKCKKVF